MSNPVPDLIICFIVIGTLAAVYVSTNFVRFYLADANDGDAYSISLTKLIDQHDIGYGWCLKLLVNSLGYCCVFVPGILIYRYTQRIKYLERCGNKGGFIPSAIRICFTGRSPDMLDRSDALSSVGSLISAKAGSTAANRSNIKNSSLGDCVLMAYCFIGLMASYLTWGLLQEKIMTQKYESTDSKGHTVATHFKDSQFLVFANRALAFVIALVYLKVKQSLDATGSNSSISSISQRAPLFKYSFASFSNIMSAWFQYEALKFVNFPTQVLAKSCKIIPVMLMGKIISRTKYEFYEYLTAALISFGMLFFLLGSNENGGPATYASRSSIASLTGVLLLAMYMTFDSFTSNWQSDLFKTYGMTSIQMMCGVNLFSTLFTATSLSIQGGFMESIVFATTHSKFIFDCVILSISSAIGQLFIFYTIAKFGPVVFTIIMTLRQAIAILLSCMVYGHHISTLGIFGVAIVFLSIFLRVYSAQRIKLLRRKNEMNKIRSGAV